MKPLAIIPLFLWSALALANECGEPGARHWNTVVKLATTEVTLHWTGVYEGSDAVCGVAYQPTAGESRTLDVFGQPSVNRSKSLIAFVSCADDGCGNNVLVADIARGAVLKAELPLVGPQSYLKAKWKGETRELIIDVESFSEGVPSAGSQYRCSVADTVRCIKHGI